MDLLLSNRRGLPRGSGDNEALLIPRGAFNTILGQ